MTRWYNDASQLALADGTTLTVGNTGGAAGRAFDGFVGTATYETSTTPDTYQCSAAGGAVSAPYYNINATSLAVEVEFAGAAAPTGGDARVIGISNGTSDVLRVEVGDGTGETARVVKVYDYGGSSGTAARLRWTSTTQWPTGAGFRVYVGATVSASGAGELHAAVYTGSDGHGATAAESYDTTDGHTGTATTAFTRVYVGKVNSTPSATYNIRTFRGDDAGYAALGPLTSLPPTANAGADQTGVEPGATVTLDGTGSSAAGGASITDYAWSQTGGTTVTLSSATASQPTFTAPPTLAGDTLTFALDVTDSAAVESENPDTMTVTVLPSTIRVVSGGAQVPGYMRVATLAPLILGEGALGWSVLG